MFVCATCSQNVGPRVKPVNVVTGIREVAYVNHVTFLDEYERERVKVVESRGTEVTSEAKVCNKCAGEEVVEPKGPAKFRGFQEPLPEPLICKVIAGVVHNALSRVAHNTKRSQADSAVAIPLVKAFVDSNRGFSF